MLWKTLRQCTEKLWRTSKRTKATKTCDGPNLLPKRHGMRPFWRQRSRRVVGNNCNAKTVVKCLSFPRGNKISMPRRVALRVNRNVAVIATNPIKHVSGIDRNETKRAKTCAWSFPAKENASGGTPANLVITEETILFRLVDQNRTKLKMPNLIKSQAIWVTEANVYSSRPHGSLTSLTIHHRRYSRGTPIADEIVINYG